LANLAAVNLHFGMKDESKKMYQNYIDLWQEEWSEDAQHQKLKKQVEQALMNLNEEYYDEEEEAGPEPEPEYE
jgi:hypothetical protein